MINANKDNLNSFYKGDIQYEVPFYQRPYVWEIDNCEILWESVYNVFEDYQNGINSEHFIGTLIIKQRQANRMGENIYDLIDGQQRLTTFALLIKAIADTCKGELPRLKEKLLELIVFEDTRAQQHIRIIHNRIDKPYFENIMFNNNKVLKSNKHKILEAYEYFYKKVQDLNDEDRDKLLKIILNKVSLISMLISADDDEQEIFDTINSLGVKLTTAELLKNYIFKEEELQELYASHWQDIYEIDEERIDFWNKDKTSGRISRTNVEILLYCYLIIETKKEVKLEKLYKEYKNWLKNKDSKGKKDFLESLKIYSDIYYQIPEGEELNEFSYSEYEKRFFHVIENLSVTTVYPLILFLYKEISNKELPNYLYFLESYIVRRNICKLTTKNYNNLFISILQKLINIKDENGLFTFEDYKNIFYNFTDETNLFPDDSLFVESFKESILINQNSKEILYCIALYQKNNELNDVTKLSSSNFSVEHIMPKMWEENWSMDNMSEQAKLERDKLLLTLGNLTLITKKLNSKMKNDSWNNKKETLRKYSSLQMTTDYLMINNWEESAIEKRANDLAKLAVEIWDRKITSEFTWNNEEKIIQEKFYSPIKKSNKSENSKSRSHTKRIIIIENDEIFCKDAVAVLIGTAKWLVKKGKITSSTCPLKLQDRGKSYLINTSPIHEDGREFHKGGHKLLSNLYLDKNWSGNICIKKAKDLLSFCGIPDTKYNLDE